MKKSLFLTLVCFSLLVLAIRFGSQPFLNFLGYQSKAGLKVTSLPKAAVFINGMEVGSTPYEDENLKVGEYEVKLVGGETSWQSRVSLTKGTLAVVNRELAPSVASSSGEVLTLISGKGVVLTSNPPGAQIEIDGKSYGKTPLSIPEITPGEHTFLLSHENYLKRSIRASLPAALSLHLDVDLAISEVEMASVPTPSVAAVPKLTVKQTSVGFLRVRSKPSVNGEEIAKVSAGENLTFLEELPGWYKVKLNSGSEGYVSSQYIQKES